MVLNRHTMWWVQIQVQRVVLNNQMSSNGALEKKKSSPELWKKSIQRRLRSKGQPYEDYKGRIQPGKSPQPCNCAGCRYRCSENIPEEVRTSACSEYWVLNDFHRQKDYIDHVANSCK